jgi:hypothetical protein
MGAWQLRRTHNPLCVRGSSEAVFTTIRFLPPKARIRGPFRVKTGKAQKEKMFSGPLPIADVTGRRRHFRVVP